MMEFEFEIPDWQNSLDGLNRGSSLSASRFLALMEPEREEALEEALDLLEEKDILLDISDLPVITPSGETALRLRREKQLVQEKKLPQGLDENDPLRLYLEEIASTPACGDPELLAERCREGDERAMEQLTALKLSRVVELAFDLAGQGVLLMDLIQEGSLGLWQAVLNCPKADFEKYCDRCIQRGLHKAVVLQARAAGVGQKLRRALEDYRSVDERLLTDLGRNPTLEEIAAQLHMTLQETETVAQMLEAARTVNRAKAETQEPEETPEDHQAVEDTAYFQMRQRISELLSILDEQEAKLLTLRFGLEGGLPLSPEETGAKLGLTPGEVIAAEAAALSKLREK